MSWQARWESSAQAPGANRTISAKFTFDPATNQLTYAVSAGFPEGEILAATIHRGAKDENGPVLAVLSNHWFQSIAGTETLSDPDRERLLSGGLYLRIARRPESGASIRISLQPANPK